MEGFLTQEERFNRSMMQTDKHRYVFTRDHREAIEDCVADREAVEAWWCKHGLRKYANAQNWTKSRALGRY